MNNTTEAQAQPIGLFAAAKEVKTAKKVADKTTVLCTEKDYPGITTALDNFIILSEHSKEVETQLEMAHNEVKQVGTKAFVKLMGQERKYTGSFKIQSESGQSVMIVPTDKYRKVADEETYNQLQTKFGAQYVERTTEYKFNSEVLERNMKAIEKAIMGCTEISDSDKMNLFLVNVSYGVKKGTIELLNSFPNPMEAIDNFQPIIQLKNVK